MNYNSATDSDSMAGRSAGHHSRILLTAQKNSGNGLDENVMNNYSWMVYQQCDDKEVVARATKWMSDVAEKSPKYMLLDTYAALLYKSGDLKKAKLYAETAIETGKRDKEDVQETEELLKKSMITGRKAVATNHKNRDRNNFNH